MRTAGVDHQLRHLVVIARGQGESSPGASISELGSGDIGLTGSQRQDGLLLILVRRDCEAYAERACEVASEFVLEPFGTLGTVIVGRGQIERGNPQFTPFVDLLDRRRGRGTLRQPREGGQHTEGPPPLRATDVAHQATSREDELRLE